MSYENRKKVLEEWNKKWRKHLAAYRFVVLMEDENFQNELEVAEIGNVTAVSNGLYIDFFIGDKMHRMQESKSLELWFVRFASASYIQEDSDAFVYTTSDAFYKLLSSFDWGQMVLELEG